MRHIDPVVQLFEVVDVLMKPAPVRVIPYRVVKLTGDTVRQGNAVVLTSISCRDPGHLYAIHGNGLILDVPRDAAS